MDPENKIKHISQILPAAVDTKHELLGQHKVVEQVEYQLLIGLGLHGQGAHHDYNEYHARPPLLQHVVWRGAKALPLIQLLYSRKFFHACRCTQI